MRSALRTSADIPKFFIPRKTIFELELTGILFKTSDLYIPDSHLSLGESIDIAETYWNPIFTREALDKREYLFQGKALIKRKIQ